MNAAPSLISCARRFPGERPPAPRPPPARPSAETLGSNQWAQGRGRQRDGVWVMPGCPAGTVSGVLRQRDGLPFAGWRDMAPGTEGPVVSALSSCRQMTALHEVKHPPPPAPADMSPVDSPRLRFCKARVPRERGTGCDTVRSDVQGRLWEPPLCCGRYGPQTPEDRGAPSPGAPGGAEGPEKGHRKGRPEVFGAGTAPRPPLTHCVPRQGHPP